MSTTVTLPDGASVVLRDPKTVSERHRRPVVRLQLKIGASPVGVLLASQPDMPAEEFERQSMQVLGSEDAALLDELADAVTMALVESWTYPVPVTLDALLDLPGAAYDALKAETSKHISAFLPSFAPTADPASPTTPSAGSSTP